MTEPDALLLNANYTPSQESYSSEASGLRFRVHGLGFRVEGSGLGFYSTLKENGRTQKKRMRIPGARKALQQHPEPTRTRLLEV